MPQGVLVLMAQLVQNCRHWPETTRFSGFPGRGKRFVQYAALFVGEVITLVVHNKVDNRPLGQRCRLVQNQAPLLDMGSERAHVDTVRVSERPGKRSRNSTEPVDLAEPGNDLVPTGGHWGRDTNLTRLP